MSAIFTNTNNTNQKLWPFHSEICPGPQALSAPNVTDNSIVTFVDIKTLEHLD